MAYFGNNSQESMLNLSYIFSKLGITRANYDQYLQESKPTHHDEKLSSLNEIIVDQREYMNSLMLFACENDCENDLECIKYLASIYNPPQEIVQECISHCIKMTKPNHCAILIFLITTYSLFENETKEMLSNLKDKAVLSELCSHVLSLSTFSYIRQQIVLCVFPSLCSLKMENDINNIYNHLADSTKIQLVKEILNNPQEWSSDFINFNLEHSQFNDKTFPKELANSMIEYCLLERKETALLRCTECQHIETILLIINNDTSQWTPDFINRIVHVYVKNNCRHTQLISQLLNSNHKFDASTINVVINCIFWGNDLEMILEKFVQEIVEFQISLGENAYKLVKSSKKLSNLFNSKKTEHYFVSVHSFEELMEIIVNTQNHKMFSECVMELMSRHNEISERKLRFYNHPNEIKVKSEINQDVLSPSHYETILEKEPIAYSKIVRFITTFSKNVNSEILHIVIQNPLFSTVSPYDAFEMLNYVKGNFELSKILMNSHDFYTQYIV